MNIICPVKDNGQGMKATKEHEENQVFKENLK